MSVEWECSHCREDEALCGDMEACPYATPVMKVPAFQNLGSALGQFQRGSVFLEGLGCSCGKGFFIEADQARKVLDGQTLTCPHCAQLRVVSRGS